MPEMTEKEQRSVLKVKTCASKPFHTELWVNPESHGNHKIKMASICCESGSPAKSLLRRLGNFHFRTKNSPKWMILESTQRNEEKGIFFVNAFGKLRRTKRDQAVNLIDKLHIRSNINKTAWLPFRQHEWAGTKAVR
ncbi:hypothetical protein P5673_013657 [Acropora cervicornis]|uniref:Uncharacterized protein n=1 Tax=Acropora cervicornis TaxID=6130 RepID=A0AAD9QL32_ACRCE|nr:hypothetical protein P5673_013657 [Acropora cervicornis]